ncbi:MAG: hypothetical protein COC01_06760 [Bacteroidetes bacterium]|nr:MAG: hypothetical protein COC01_06760 [Bacteroidota bacterium]
MKQRKKKKCKYHRCDLPYGVFYANRADQLYSSSKCRSSDHNEKRRKFKTKKGIIKKNNCLIKNKEIMSENLTKEQYTQLRFQETLQQQIEMLKELLAQKDQLIESLEKNVAQISEAYKSVEIENSELKSENGNLKTSSGDKDEVIEQLEVRIEKMQSEAISSSNREFLAVCQLDVICKELYLRGKREISLAEINRVEPGVAQLIQETRPAKLYGGREIGTTNYLVLEKEPELFLIKKR